MSDEPLRPPGLFVPQALDSLTAADLDVLSQAADILAKCDEQFTVPGHDMGHFTTRTMRPGYVRQQLQLIVEMRRGHGTPPFA